MGCLCQFFKTQRDNAAPFGSSWAPPTQDTALKGRRFESIEEQNQWLMHWEEQWAAKRIHGRMKRQVQEMFEEEKPFLLNLP